MAEIRSIMVPGQSGQKKVCEISSQRKNMSMAVHACLYSYGRNCKTGGYVQASMVKK
jgi:hypothetical protein